MGVVSTNPAVVAEGASAFIGAGYHFNQRKPAISLAGRVPVNVSEANGPIHTGDRLTVSKTLPGYAMKMTESGQSLGIALEPSAGRSKIAVFINLGYQRMTGGEDAVAASLQAQQQQIEELKSQIDALKAKVK